MTNPLAQDLGGVVRLLEESQAARNNRDHDHADYLSREFTLAAARLIRTHSAEIAGALEQLRDLHDSIRTVYDAVPALPITADTMDAATDALHAFCLLVGIHRVDVGDPQPPAMQQGGGGG